MIIGADARSYIEMLERQQEQLVNGLREMYSLLQSGRGWPGHCLSEANGSTPLTHDILKELGVLQQTQDDYRTCEHVECYSLQQKLLEVRQICFLEDSTESPVCAQSLELSLLPPQEEMEETFHTGSSDYSDAVPGLLSRHPYLFLQDFCKSSVPPTVAPSMFSHATSSDFQANAAMIGNEQLSFWNNLPMSLEGCGMR